MQLDSYIKDLLYRYECVIIPGLGAFLANYRPARIDGTAGNFYPPDKRLSFNEQLQVNDGLLAGHVAKTAEVSYEEALQGIRKSVTDIRQRLHKGKKVSFDGIGELKRNGQNAIEFEPDTEVNYLMASFGLAPLALASGEVERSGQKVVPLQPSTSVATAKAAGARPYLRYAAVGLLALGLAGFGSLYFYSAGVKQHNLAERQKAQQQVEAEIQQATFVVDNPLGSLTVSAKKQSGPYHVIAGAFRVPENAQEKTEQLQNMGYAARNLGSNRFGLQQVTYGSFEARNEALELLREVKRTENPDAWLLVQEITD